MYNPAIHNVPTQTNESSQNFERWLLQKQLNRINKTMNSSDKKTNRILEQVCSNQTHFFFMNAVGKDTFVWIIFIFIITDLIFSHSTLFFSLVIIEKIGSIRIFHFVETTKTTNGTKYSTPSTAFTKYQCLCLLLCWVQISFVSERVLGAIQQFPICCGSYKLLNFGTAFIIKNHHDFIF